MYKKLLKAIGSKKLHTFERSPWARTLSFLQNVKINFRSKMYRILKFAVLLVYPIKKDIIDIFRYFTSNISAPSIFVQIS